MTLIVGETATRFFGMSVIKSGLTFELKTGMALSRGMKASYAAKHQLAQAGVKYKGKVITRRTRIPLAELITMYNELYEKYQTENQNVLRENITDYTGKE